MADYFKRRNIQLRFIEFMDVGNSNQWDSKHVLPSEEIINMLNEEFFNNEMDLINGNVERADYRNKKNDILRTLNDINTDGAALADCAVQSTQVL